MSDPGTNTSATGGPMLPNVTPAPLEGTDLLDLIQETLVAVSGIATNNVRPRFQAEPPDIPTAGTAWLSFGIQERPSDTFPVIQHDGAANGGLGQDDFQINEDLIVLCSFYDNGSTGAAYQAAAQVRDCLMIPQNMEALGLQGIAWKYSDGLTILPSLLKTMWLFRVDLNIHFSRTVNRSFRVENLVSAQGTIEANTAGGERTITDPFSVNPP